MRRFLQHVLPRGFHKVRYYGLWSAPSRTKLRRLQLALGSRVPEAEPETSDGARDDDAPAPRHPLEGEPCPHCGKGRLVYVKALPPRRDILPWHGFGPPSRSAAPRAAGTLPPRRTQFHGPVLLRPALCPHSPLRARPPPPDPRPIHPTPALRGPLRRTTIPREVPAVGTNLHIRVRGGFVQPEPLTAAARRKNSYSLAGQVAGLAWRTSLHGRPGC
jgi:hypothetical protein